ncbi:MAG: murC [Candidatus Saccharibacteria bacterium]|nr:murC [Candidatus Saccharibacteria bacterium]
MNIYFCGIGGVGLGPLAEIALDAGHSVIGSDPKPSLMTEQMAERGVTIGTDQSGRFLQSSHDQQPVDWFIYTSALPADHPELLLAKDLGIKTTKRDELLVHIIAEKGLKLIAVAGTHGKTTTTAMAVWAFKQLGIPVSYSIGTTVSFGPSGQFDPASEYFIYECDEYDRNFLYFHPYLSLITALSYDHPDTYLTEADYSDAFTQFAGQSQSTILWQKDADQLGEVDNAWILGEHDLININLPGAHYRENASLVVKALEKLAITGDSIDALNQYPGVDRRFEKLADNVYTDYAIHPNEIAATLKLAHELNDDIVLVYQPHQNVRQHAVRSEYAHSFELASDVYWLPTYLTREDSSLAVLTPTELTKDINNQSAVHIAELDDTLWGNVQAARDRGALVLFMGAGSIDGWVREKLTV